MGSWIGRLAVMGVVLGVVAGCSQAVPGAISLPSSTPGPSVPEPTTSGQTPSTGVSPMSPPPEVTAPIARPLDLSRFTTAPCTALTPEQVTGFLGKDVLTTPELNHPYGPNCDWIKTVAPLAYINLNFDDFPDGLTEIYLSSSVFYKFILRLDPVKSYPAMAYGLADERSEGACSLRIKTSDHTTISIEIQLGEQFVGSKDPCVVGHEVATTIIGNIQGAQ